MRRAAPLAALLLAAAALPAQDGGKKYAVLVGVNKYQHGKLQTLRFAEADVIELKKVLAADYEVTLLTGSALCGRPSVRMSVPRPRSVASLR